MQWCGERVACPFPVKYIETLAYWQCLLAFPWDSASFLLFLKKMCGIVFIHLKRPKLLIFLLWESIVSCVSQMAFQA